MDSISLTLPAALLAGLAFGAGPCNVTCLPYLGPVFLRGDGIGKSWRIVLPFTLGRLSGYSLLGLAAGMAGQALTEWLQTGLAGWILGLAAILVGFNLLRQQPNSASCDRHNHSLIAEHSISLVKQRSNLQQQRILPGALFGMGAGMALNPCVPLTAILAAAATSGSAISGLGLGLSFGLGAVIIPAFVFGLLMAHFGHELKQHTGNWSKHVEKVSGILLIALGAFTITGWIQP